METAERVALPASDFDRLGVPRFSVSPHDAVSKKQTLCAYLNMHVVLRPVRDSLNNPGKKPFKAAPK